MARLFRFGLVLAVACAAIPAIRAQMGPVVTDSIQDHRDPAQAARECTAMVFCRVAQVGVAMALIRRGSLPYHDVVMEQVKVLWQEEPGMRIGGRLRIRLPAAQPPYVAVDLGAQPVFAAGERYLLCLADRSTMTPEPGLPHWFVQGDTYGAFLITPGGAIRKVPHPESPIPLPCLVATLLDSARDPGSALFRKRLREWNPGPPSP